MPELQRTLIRTPSSTICGVYLEKKEEGAEVLLQVDILSS